MKHSAYTILSRFSQSEEQDEHELERDSKSEMLQQLSKTVVKVVGWSFFCVVDNGNDAPRCQKHT